MHPYLADQLAEARHRDLVAQAEAESAARRVRRAHEMQAIEAGEAVRSWRVALAHRLVAAGLRLGVPPSRRPSARRQARALLTGSGDDLIAERPLPTPC